MAKSGGIMSRAENYADKFLGFSKNVLPHVTRLCLVNTFLEDGLRMVWHWQLQQEYIKLNWDYGLFLATMFVVVSSVGQLGGVLMILFRKKVGIACGILLSIVVLQNIAYEIQWDLPFLFHNRSIFGGLALVLVESKIEARNTAAGVPSRPSYLKLGGRILVVFMFLTLFRFDASDMEILQIVVGGLLMALVAFGYRTKLSALLLVLWLTVFNVYFNAWWFIPSHIPMRDFLKYDFFQALSVIGGLLMLVSLESRSVKMDEHKK